MADCKFHVNCRCTVQPIIDGIEDELDAVRIDHRAEEVARQKAKAEFWNTMIGKPVLIRHFAPAYISGETFKDYYGRRRAKAAKEPRQPDNRRNISLDD